MTTTRNQFPQGYQISDKNGIIQDPYYFFLKNLSDTLPPGGDGYVIDGTYGSTGLHFTMNWGLDSDKGTPITDGYVYFATDSGKIYISNGSTWVLESPAFTGDVTKAVGSTVTSLSTVLANPGTYGGPGTTAQFTVNAQGRITAVSDLPNANDPGGNDGNVQFNNAGAFGGVSTFTYDLASDILTLTTLQVNDQITFTDPTATRTNLLPIQTGLSGYALVTNGTDVSWEPIGPLEFVFHYGDSTPTLLFTCPANKVITSCNFFITTAFDGVGASVSVGDSSNYNSVMASTDSDISNESNWANAPGVFFGSDTAIYLSINAGSGASMGQGLLTITFQE